MAFVCPVCENEDFDEDDGRFYCTECGTQSQELIVQENVSDTFLRDDINILRHEVKTAKAKSKTQTPKCDLGRPWTIYEAYQIIILAQADALVELGACAELKEIVYTIWANYLSKLGVAFCKTERLIPKIVEKTQCGRRRELRRGTFRNPKNKVPRPVEDDSDDDGKKSPHASGDNETEKGDDEMSGNDGELERNDVDENVEEDDDIVFLEPGYFKLESSKELTLKYSRAKRSAEWMDIHKTLALCYLGLTITNPAILVSDVVRWVYEGQVPFFSTTHLLPEDMVLSGYDSKLFSVNSVSSTLLNREVKKLRRYMGIEPVTPCPVETLIKRFACDLYLPAEMEALCLRLLAKFPCKWKVDRNEVRAAAYIILCFKIIFVLDDNEEWRLSQYSRQLSDAIQAEQNIFVWSGWKEFLVRKCETEFDPRKLLTCNISDTKLEHMEHLLSFYDNTKRDQERFSTAYFLSRRGRINHTFDREFQEALARPLQGIKKSQGKGKEENEKRDNLAEEGEHFRKSTVSHLVDAALFKKRFRSDDKDQRKRLCSLLSNCSLLEKETHSLVVYGLPRTEEDMSTRHSNYLWLLRLIGDLIDCPILILEKNVYRLVEVFLKPHLHTFAFNWLGDDMAMET